jgi:putative ABC transport system ATP-binding protein
VQPIITAENVSKIYHAGKIEVPALRNASFTVEAGEFVSIVGPSGSGKSTLFYILGGLTRPTSGRVMIDDTDFSSLNDAERTRMRKTKIGFVFQRFNLLPTLTAMQNIEIAHEISGRKDPLDRSYLEHLTNLLGIGGRLEHRPSELSGGEQQELRHCARYAFTLESRAETNRTDDYAQSGSGSHRRSYPAYARRGNCQHRSRQRSADNEVVWLHG